jgi:L,D-peptidoglycan transpeptidase YkuD (ErfK/YbiS/YcfS/YnhG family)
VSARVRRRRALAALLVVVLAGIAWTLTAGRRNASDDASALAPTSSPSAATASTASTASTAAPQPAGDPTATSTSTAAPAGSGSASAPASGSTAGATQPPAPPAAGSLAQVARLGPTTAATVPVASTQAVVVRGDGADGTTAGIELYERDARGWRRTGEWRGHVGAGGWTDDHHEGDLSTPVGTYTLSDAGGRLPDPGSELPYHRSADFVPSGDGVFGDSLAGSFDYVLAVDFNRVRGRSPLDAARPQGRAKGGGIWLHVDHDGPTHGCVSVPEEGMRTLLRALLPAAHPVVVMADAARLAA